MNEPIYLSYCVKDFVLNNFTVENVTLNFSLGEVCATIISIPEYYPAVLFIIVFILALLKMLTIWGKSK